MNFRIAIGEPSFSVEAHPIHRDDPDVVERPIIFRMGHSVVGGSNRIQGHMSLEIERQKIALGIPGVRLPNIQAPLRRVQP